MWTKPMSHNLLSYAFLKKELDSKLSLQSPHLSLSPFLLPCIVSLNNWFHLSPDFFNLLFRCPMSSSRCFTVNANAALFSLWFLSSSLNSLVLLNLILDLFYQPFSIFIYLNHKKSLCSVLGSLCAAKIASKHWNPNVFLRVIVP